MLTELMLMERHVIFFVHKPFLELHSKTDVAFYELTEVDWD